MKEIEEDKKFYWKDTVPDLSWRISIGVVGKFKKKKQFGLQLDMNGWTRHTEAVPQTARKVQAFDIQSTQSIFGSFLVIKRTSHIYKAFTAKQQCNDIFEIFQTSLCLNIVGTVAPQNIKVRSCSVVKCIGKSDLQGQTKTIQAGVQFSLRRKQCPTLLKLCSRTEISNSSLSSFLYWRLKHIVGY